MLASNKVQEIVVTTLPDLGELMTESFQTFFVDKSSGTHADELLVAGVVRLLDRAMRRAELPSAVTWQDHGSHYRISLAQPLAPHQLESRALPLPCAPFIRTLKNSEQLPELPPNEDIVLDYEAIKERNQTFWEAFKSLGNDAKRQYAQGESIAHLVSVASPHPDWDLLRMINPAALISYNGLMGQWWQASSAALPELLGIIGRLFSHTPNDVATAEAEWKKLAKEKGLDAGDTAASASQLFNPSQGKGINRPKTNGTGLGNVKNFWLLEWLKAIGMFEAGFTKTLQGSNDRKTYVPVVGHMTHHIQRQIMSRFKAHMPYSQGAVLSDILTIIRYLNAFMAYVQEAQEGDDADADYLLSFMATDPKPASSMRGFQMTYYKDMGNASTVMNIAFLNMPHWVTIRHAEDVATYQTILEEHEKIVTQFKEDRGEEIELLQAYRDFIVADNLTPFLDFTAAYSSYIISQREKRGGFAYQFETDNLRRLLMSSEPTTYTPILENEGFQNIAYAIRQSTVIAQMRKKEGDRRYDVRYGLGQDLLRKSQYAHEFLKAITEFITRYNAENAQVMESRPGPYRRSIRTDDVADIVRLIDEYQDAELICKMLIAFGYARDGRKQEETHHETTTS